uniref:Uncharacterized protein n=1 Tax=Anguilla anguilla TaxID=7936 RepID=A0A0E9S2D3_ANGAN
MTGKSRRSWSTEIVIALFYFLLSLLFNLSLQFIVFT